MKTFIAEAPLEGVCNGLQVLVVLPAEDGRRRRPPAGPAWRRVERVLMSRASY